MPSIGVTHPGVGVIGQVVPGGHATVPGGIAPAIEPGVIVLLKLAGEDNDAGVVGVTVVGYVDANLADVGLVVIACPPVIKSCSKNCVLMPTKRTIKTITKIVKFVFKLSPLLNIK